MNRIVLVTGGARSGKSTFAESIYKDIEDVVYIATSRAYDDEMKERVMLHRQSRPKEWTTFEGNYDLHGAFSLATHCLLDCLTVLTSNIMFDMTKEYEQIPMEIQREVEEKVLYEIRRLIDRVHAVGGNLVMVTNEVGCSIVPETHIARVYRDIIGRVNQRVAALCNEVYLVTCGIPLRIK
ncbi:MAG: bifunctional adenosylcobinamide kinase/adenosylcobinamide-phosphate guanylyltransferase [Firmicutes bacterium]|nr:bifunctional adenosylcobinamide kinase/adenosylcobinamide-phosphate guanylyltransferase [Bacillota bacterium]